MNAKTWVELLEVKELRRQGFVGGNIGDTQLHLHLPKEQLHLDALAAKVRENVAGHLDLRDLLDARVGDEARLDLVCGIQIYFDILSGGPKSTRCDA